MRKIIHIDMDAFFASVEQRENPKLRGKPIAVGGRPDQRGVVATASYEARKFGIHSAMPMVTALRMCPELIIVKPNFLLYRAICEEVREIFFNHTELVEPLSIDEAYLDVTYCAEHQGSATLIAKSILAEINAQTQLTASAGVSYNKFLAKYASNVKKPAGIYVIQPQDAESILMNLPVEKFHGIGPATAKKLNELGIFFGRDFRRMSLTTLQNKIGKSALFYYNLALGEDNREVKTERITKSVANETTFANDIYDYQILQDKLIILLNETLKSLRNKNLYGRTLTVKIKYANFKQQTKSFTDRAGINSSISATIIASELLKQFKITQAVRLLGVGFSNLISQDETQAIQLRLFD